jgi:preprotein translocase subunit SecE
VKDKDKARIIALQKQLSIARGALQKAAFGDLRQGAANEALEEMNKIEWASKPNLVQDAGYLGRI